jgi:deoxyribodipyrimidine photo-lyase
MPDAAFQYVWFKRDLRVHDHAPLAEAAARGPVLPLYILEPGLWRQPDASPRQWAFVRESLQALREALAALGQPLVLRTGDAVAVLEALARTHPPAALWSHQETGNGWTFARDRAVAAWARGRGIAWHEPRQHGVVRGLRRREGWAAQWGALMQAPPHPPPRALAPLAGLAPGALPARPFASADAAWSAPALQRGGRAEAEATLAGFLHERGEHYTRLMSRPDAGATACTRLSPHLAHGTLSMREALHAIDARDAALRALPPAARGQWPRALASARSRLHWHCHFIQKLESEPAIEGRNVHRGYDGLREDAFERGHFEAWAAGATGWPFVDACMRSLAATGWLNFRARAMLVAIASWQLWLHWREPGLHLARLFTDFEPGIHWSQMQMQAGVTGINIPRMYDPLKQSLDQDPEGRFIRRWVPELAGVPGDWVHAPWRMPEALQRRAGVRIGRDYPAPRVDAAAAAREAKARLARWRAGARGFAAISEAVLVKHGSRRRRLAPDPRPAPPAPPQGTLF